MNRIILKYDCDLYTDLSSYLLGLNGINDVLIDMDKGTIDILYDFSIISLYIICREIGIFLGIDKISSLIGFDKCFNTKLEHYDIIIKDLCCEYCLKGNIEELLLVDGISKVTTDYDYMNKVNVKIDILYDSRLIDEKEIIKLEKKFNCE